MLKLFGPKDVPAATTISGLIEIATKWLAREVSDKSLQASLETVQARVTEGYDRTRLDISQTDLASGLREMAVTAVNALSDVLLAIAMMRQAGDNVTAVETALEDLKNSAQAFGKANSAVDAYKKSQTPSCPLCGRRQVNAREWHCSACDIHMVVPDNSGNQYPEINNVGPDYLNVFRACHNVADGAITIPEFLATLPPLEEQFLLMVQYVTQSQEHVGDAGSLTTARDLQAVYEQIELTRDGLQRLRRFEETHAIADINTGWGWIARAVINLQQLIPSLHNTAENLASENPAVSPHLQVHDSVLIGAEDE